MRTGQVVLSFIIKKTAASSRKIERPVLKSPETPRAGRALYTVAALPTRETMVRKKERCVCSTASLEFWKARFVRRIERPVRS